MAVKKATAKALDFTNVKEAGNFNPRHRKAGDYKMKVVGVEDAVSKKDASMWIFHCVVPSDKRALYPYYCVIDDKNLWKIRNLFVACGVAVPKKKVKVDPNKLIGKFFGATLEDDEYEGKMKSTIQSTFPVDELDADEPEGSDDVDEDEDIDNDDDSDDDDEELELDDL